MSDLKDEILQILKRDWTDERKAEEIYREALDSFMPGDAEMWDS